MLYKYLFRIYCLIFAIFISYSADAQRTDTIEIRVKVVDSISNKPIMFAVVAVQRTQVANYTNSEGNALLDHLQLNDGLIVFCTGYNRKKLNLRKEDSLIIVRMASVVSDLDEVVIKPKDWKRKKIPFISHHEDYPFSASGGGFELATRIDFPDEALQKRIVSVTIRIDKVDANNACRLNIYKEGTEGAPGEEILYSNIIVTPESNSKKLIVDLTEERIVFNDNAIFVGIEWLGNNGDGRRNIITPKLSMTGRIAVGQTYARKVYPNDWRLISTGLQGEYNPSNMMVSVEYEQ